MTDPTDLTPAEQAAAEYLWSQFGAGAARWQGGLVAVEPGYTATPFGVWGENEFEAVPIGVARVSYATARRIAVEYVKHGSRPEWLSWAQGHFTASYLREEL